MKKLSLVVFIILFFFIFLNIGKWLDVTQKPVKTDLVVCLGGGTLNRVKKSIEMIEKGYADHFLLIGESWYNQPYIRKNYPNLSVEINEIPKNTEEEVFVIKQYMIKHGYKSTLIVTDPPHSRRVKILFSKHVLKGEQTLCFHMISSNVKWWDALHYYENKVARSAVWHEGLKVVYTILFIPPVRVF